MRERVRRIKATWDEEIEFKSATKKKEMMYTHILNACQRQTHNEGRKQTCYQGLEPGAEPFNNLLSAPKMKTQKEEKERGGRARMRMLGV